MSPVGTICFSEIQMHVVLGHATQDGYKNMKKELMIFSDKGRKEETVDA